MQIRQQRYIVIVCINTISLQFFDGINAKNFSLTQNFVVVAVVFIFIYLFVFFSLLVCAIQRSVCPSRATPTAVVAFALLTMTALPKLNGHYVTAFFFFFLML